jgi:hypothetical protein
MAKKTRTVEVFTAGCPACDEVVKLVNELACESCRIEVLDMRDENVAARARSLGVRSVPAVVVDGRLADCCARQGVTEEGLRSAGVGSPA